MIHTSAHALSAHRVPTHTYTRLCTPYLAARDVPTYTGTRARSWPTVCQDVTKQQRTSGEISPGVICGLDPSSDPNTPTPQGHVEASVLGHPRALAMARP
eukprot:CAMPEP_0198694826 /NCGR_PEP_ID=MMETSP1468-20131203/277045_1 /TAXON_ID=1461545 /ORGANISM="Mantoniella sp, Strain CCMP1436" /LENGTH=99 /DNA_ID=CAMNT_0044450247 /DNA_START=23 /DNA_END=318 /DNA_ORIENTATION=+